MSVVNSPRLAPYRIKMDALKVGESVIIPKTVFQKWPPKEKERPVSNGPKVWVMIAQDEK
jgi:hypothetical protein